MAILIDSFFNERRGPIRFWRRRCGHLVSDASLEELHNFAEGLGLRREWFQEKSIPREIVLRAVRMDGKSKYNSEPASVDDRN